ncbi:hypothetical protein R6Q57_029809 [Mikania cordata]
MTTLVCNDNWIQFNYHENMCFDDEEESLSLCDLPTNDHQIETNLNSEDNDPVDFEFGSSLAGAGCQSPENMCNADEVFFKGQILPLINRSASVSVASSRSNENDPITIQSKGYGYWYKPKIRNQFHTHPSPSPQIRTQSFRTLSHSKQKPSSFWSFLQVSLVRPQEIGLSDLKNRSKRFGSHNSRASSSMDSTNDQNQNQNKMKHRKNTKKKQRLLFSGCNCSADSIKLTINETVPKKMMTKNENMLHVRDLLVSEERTMSGDGKHPASRHRTFEWLKQLSMDATSEA